MSAPEFDVRYVATLARLNLTDEEIRTFQNQLGDVLAFVDALKKVDVTGVEPTAHTSDVFNVFRQDVARPGLTSAEALSNAPRKANDLFVVTKVVE
ncbi:glutamyl-tRNA amidotransferase [Verrucomicrobia bacterium SCGC AG-212-E04]|nr:glutamyl-tRNA amidotransferase [Verrucomicrobia bacterium SCGC AG-212-E04]